MDLSERLAKLTPEERKRLETRLRERPGSSRAPLETIAKRPSGEPAYVSFSQERLWFLEQLDGASAIYNICLANRLRGSLRVDCLEQALGEIIRRHEALRTKFPDAAVSQRPLQQISEATDFRLQVSTLTADATEHSGQAIREKVEDIARLPISLAEASLFRGYLLRVGAEDHILVLVVHHIVADSWSFEIIFRELSVLYADFLNARLPSLPPLILQYSDFAYWQRKVLQGEKLSRELSFWKERLAGIPPLLELPTDFPRPAEQTYQGAWCEREIGRTLTAKVERFVRESDATLFMVILAAFQTLLHRYSGQSDILVGSPITSRSRVEFEPVVGFFVNMLPVRGDFSGDPTARELIKRARTTTLEMLAHQEIPFEVLVRELRPERNLSHAPLFQSALMLQQNEHQLLQLPGVSTEPVSVDTGTAKFDLTLYASETPQGLRVWLEYSTDLFSAPTAERMLRHLECLLESIVDTPDSRVSQLELLPAPERRQIIAEWNNTTAEYPSTKTIHQLFDEQVARTPRATAVQFEREHLNYRTLKEKSEALASLLRQKGVRAETRVGIYVERSIDMVVAVLGVLKAGGAYIPLDPVFPKDRLAFMVEDAQVQILVTQSRLVNELPQHRAEIICVDRVDDDTFEHSNATVTANHLAYILYTSGSTGRPKGVQIPHGAVVNFLHSMSNSPGIQAHDILVAITTLSFDIAGLELFLPLIVGAKIVIAARDDAVDPVRLANLIESSGATVMQATPATWRLLLDSGWLGHKTLKILCGGEAIDSELANRLLNRCGELWNMYGPTETTIWSTIERLMLNQPIAIGRPIANTQVYILDSNRQPTPPGVIGELYIGGRGVARGYLNRPELTKEKFVEDPFGVNGSGFLYRTGDLARFRSDGRIIFLGRTDHQVKVRGFRIEIGEIETALTAIRRVAQAVVTLREDVPGQKRLVAYIVRDPGIVSGRTRQSHVEMPLDAVTLRATLRKKLPEYTVPAAFVFLDALPLTPNGKIDRKALPAPEMSLQPGRRFEPAKGPAEEKLARIMASLLKTAQVGRTDDFFELGGHSILAVALFSEIEREFGQRIPLATLFRAPTIEGLAKVLTTEREPTRKWASLVPIQQADGSPNFFCVHGAGGNVLLYRTLVRALGNQYSFYGLQSRGLDKQSAPLRTIEDMAEKYLEEIHEVQREGPYYLGGYCLGGTIAYEIAQQLRQRGHEVRLLALFDTYNYFGVKEGNPLRYLWQKIIFHSGNLRGVSWRDLPGYFSTKLRVATDGEFSSLMSTVTASLHRKRSPDKSAPVLESVQTINDTALAAYRPMPYAGRVTVFKPKVNYDFLADPKMGWSDIVTGELDIIELPVNPHAMLVEPFVKHLAEELRRRLDQESAEVASANLPQVESHSLFS